MSEERNAPPKVGETTLIRGRMTNAQLYDNDQSKEGKYYQFKLVTFETDDGPLNVKSVKIPWDMVQFFRKGNGRVWHLMKRVTGYHIYAVEDDSGVIHENLSSVEKERTAGVIVCIIWSLIFGMITVLSAIGASGGSDAGAVLFLISAVMTGLGVLGIFQNGGLNLEQATRGVVQSGSEVRSVQKTRTWK